MARVLILSGIFYIMVLLTMKWNSKNCSKIASNMQKNLSVERLTSDKNYTQIINFWEKHKNKLVLRGDHKEIVLVMGNAGVSKTALISALIGRKRRYIVAKENEYFEIVDDEEKIDAGTSSEPLIPELMIDKNNNLTYINYPELRDSQNTDYEISLTYFQNILMNQIKKIKLILVINHESLKTNEKKNDFDNLLNHIGTIIKNISKIHNGVALVAIKVENLYNLSDSRSLIVSNDNPLILKGIENFLKNKRKTYLNKRENSEKYKMFVDLIDVLLQKNGNSFNRIALLRQPTHIGLLENSSETKIQINGIINMIVNNLHYDELNKNDFNRVLSEFLKNVTDQISDDIFKGPLTNCLQKINNEIFMQYLQMEKDYSDIGLLQKRILHVNDIFAQIKKVNGPLEFFKKFFDTANTLKIRLSLASSNNISENIKKLYFFTTLSNNNTHILWLKNKMQNVIDLIENLKNFYNFLDDLQENLATLQLLYLGVDKPIKNVTTLYANLTNLVVHNITNLNNFVEETGSDEIQQKVIPLNLNQFEFKHMKAVFGALTTKFEFVCPSSSEEMTVKGFNIKMSDVIKTDCWMRAKIIQIFALNKVLIDCTVNKTATQAQLIIIAPTWEILGKQKIILDGKAGKPHERKSAKSSSFQSEKGTNGLPGFPGDPAGHFFGVGKRFINSEYLEIYANGGKGGPGQHGGNGADGIPGEGLSHEFFKMRRIPADIEKYFKDHNYEYSWVLIKKSYLSRRISSTYFADVLGKPAIKPSDGGDGGAGGQGGYPGNIIINSLGELVNVKTSNHSGSIGQPGQGGLGGRNTSDGQRVKFFLYYQTFFLPFPPTIDYNVQWTDGAKIPSGKNGNPGSNDYGKQLPTTLPMASLYISINSYKDFVRMNLYENIKESELKSFIHELENDNYIKLQYNTLAFVKEFRGLENQFFELKNKIDFVPIYNSLLTRIEEYAKSEKNLNRKKVLNYIYTAALTKLFALKEKRKGQTAVDLYKYLNTIETSVKEIHGAQHLQIVRKYQDDYEKTLLKKIREAEDFIQDKIEPDINKLLDESDRQIKAIIDEINENQKSNNDALELLEKNKLKIRQMMLLRAGLLPLKLAASLLSFFGPIGAGVGVAVTTATSIADGMLLDTSSGLGQGKIYSLNPNLKLMSRVTEVFNNKQKLVTDKLYKAIEKLEEYEKEFLVSSEMNALQKKRTIRRLKTQLQEAMFRKTGSVSDVLQNQKDIKEIETKLTEFTNSEKDILDKIREEEKNVKDLEKEKKYETRLRRINDLQSVLNSAELVFSFIKQIENDQGMIENINDQLSKTVQQLRDLEKMQNQVYDIIVPDFRQIENTIKEVKNSVNGSSHVKLDLTKWNVRTTLRDVKSLLQKFTQKMSFELRNNLERYIEKIDEGFSILIDIYDRIDTYSDSVKQAEYMAHIVSAPMTNVHVTDSELSKAIVDLKLIIQSNILFEKYNIALHAFKQRFFPFAAHFLKKFQLPTNVQLNNTESLRSSIIERIKDMKNYIDENEATMGAYSEYIHEKKIFDSHTAGSSPFYVWKHHTIKDEIQRLLNGSEILLKADISKGLFYNSVKYNDIGINFKFNNKTLQNSFTSILKNFKLTMTMIGNNYYRCGEHYYFISFDDIITISYTLNQDERKNWIDPNKVYTKIRNSYPVLSPYAMWSIQLSSVHKSVSFKHLNVYANEKIDIELVGQGYYIEQNVDFNFEVCNEYLDLLYDVETIVKEFVLTV